MARFSVVLALAFAVVVGGSARADEAPPDLQVATGLVEKVEGNTLVLRPRGAEGRFEKALTFQLTGTTKVTTVSRQMRGRKPVIVQRETEARDLQPNQPIAVIYTHGPAGPVLLKAVAQPVER